MSLRVGIDIGSTTVKVVVLDEQNKLLFRSYERHYSKTRERALRDPARHLRDMLAGNSVSTGHHRLCRTGRGQGRGHRLRTGGLRHRRRGARVHTSRHATRVIELGARTPRSFSSAAPWRSG
ncbi:MAG: hypothetical protein ACLUJG_08470 [Lawsonibacter sp.]